MGTNKNYTVEFKAKIALAAITGSAEQPTKTSFLCKA